MPISTKCRGHNDVNEFTDINKFTQSESFSGLSSVHDRDEFCASSDLSSLDHALDFDQSFSAVTNKHPTQSTASNTNTSRIYVKPSSLSESINGFDDESSPSDKHVDLDRTFIDVGLSDHDLSGKNGCDDDFPRYDDVDDDGDDTSSSDDEFLNEPRCRTYESDDYSLQSSSGFSEDSISSTETNDTPHTWHKDPIIVNPSDIKYRGFQTYSEAIEFIGKVPVVEPRPVDETSDTASRIELDLLYDSICNARNEAYKEKMKKKRKKSSTLKRLFLSCFPCFIKKNRIADEDDDVTSSIVIV